MSISTLVTGLMITYFICAYFVAYKFTVLVFKGSSGEYYGFKVKWYHKLTGTYVLALPIFLILTYFVGEV